MDLAPNSTSELAVRDGEARANPFRRPVVLVIDDDEPSSTTLCFLLRNSGFEAELSLTGADALSKALIAPPDAVILDLHLADNDIPGFVVLESLRAKYADLPIIAVTGWYLEDDHASEAWALGVTDYLWKPLDESEVAASLHAALAGLHRRLDSVGSAKHTASSSLGRVEEAGSDQNSTSQLAQAENAFISNRLATLVRRIRYSFPTVWADVITEEVEDTLLELLAKLRRGIWPVRGSLDAHLRHAAWRNVRDRLQAAKRRAANEARYAIEHASRTRADAARDSAARDATDSRSYRVREAGSASVDRR
jgi:DNA-binding response OmpR family regulator